MSNVSKSIAKELSKTILPRSFHSNFRRSPQIKKGGIREEESIVQSGHQHHSSSHCAAAISFSLKNSSHPALGSVTECADKFTTSSEMKVKKVFRSRQISHKNRAHRYDSPPPPPWRIEDKDMVTWRFNVLRHRQPRGYTGCVPSRLSQGSM